MVRLLMLEKPKLSFNISGSFQEGNRKIPKKLFHDHYCLDDHLGIDDWDFALFEQSETHSH